MVEEKFEVDGDVARDAIKKDTSSSVEETEEFDDTDELGEKDLDEIEED